MKEISLPALSNTLDAIAKANDMQPLEVLQYLRAIGSLCDAAPYLMGDETSKDSVDVREAEAARIGIELHIKDAAPFGLSNILATAAIKTKIHGFTPDTFLDYHQLATRNPLDFGDDELHHNAATALKELRNRLRAFVDIARHPDHDFNQNSAGYFYMRTDASAIPGDNDSEVRVIKEYYADDPIKKGLSIDDIKRRRAIKPAFLENPDAVLAFLDKTITTLEQHPFIISDNVRSAVQI